MNRRKFIVGASTVGVTSIAGCTGILEDEEELPETVKIGVALPDSGSASSLGRPLRQVADLAIERLNDKIEQTEFETHVIDTESTGNLARQRVEDLITDKEVTSVVGPATLKTVTEASSVLTSERVAGITPSATSPLITELSDDDYLFRTCASNALQGKVFAKETDSNANVVVLHEDTDYASSIAYAFDSTFEGTSSTQSFEVGKSDYTNELNEAFSSNPDVIFLVSFLESSIEILKSFYQNYDNSTPFYVTNDLRENLLPYRVDNPMENVTGISHIQNGPSINFFKDLYRSTYGNGMEEYTAETYDAINILALSSGRAYYQNDGNITGSSIRDSLREVTNPGGETVQPGDNIQQGWERLLSGDEIQYRGASSAVNIDTNGDITTATYDVFKFNRNGVVSTDETIEYQEE